MVDPNEWQSPATNPWALPAAVLLTTLGVCFLLLGLVAVAASADVEGLTREDLESAKTVDELPPGVTPDAIFLNPDGTGQSGTGSDPGDLTEGVPVIEGGASESGDSGPQGSVSDLVGDQPRDFPAPPPTKTVETSNGQEVEVDCSTPGICTVTSPNGDQMYFVDDPSDLPAGASEGDGNVFVPNPNGDIGGFKVGDDGSLIPVPIDEIDDDTMALTFGPDGSVELLEQGQGLGRGTELVPGNPGQLQRGESVPGAGAGESFIIETRNGDLTVECTSAGCRVVSQETGGELYMLEDGEPGGPTPTNPDAAGNVLVPDPNGDIVGFKLNDEGELEIVKRGEEDEDTIALVFGADGSVELLQEGQVPGLGVDLVPNDPSQDFGDLPEWQGELPGTDAAPKTVRDRLLGPGFWNNFRDWPLIVGGLLLLGGLALGLWYVWGRTGSRVPEPEASAGEATVVGEAWAQRRNDQSLVVDSLLHQLRTEPEPRVAIQQAYAAMEAGFGRPELARRRSDSALAHLNRVLGQVDGAQQPLVTLTRLFERARFSNQPVDESMREQAIEAVLKIRETYATPLLQPIG